MYLTLIGFLFMCTYPKMMEPEEYTPMNIDLMHGFPTGPDPFRADRPMPAQGSTNKMFPCSVCYFRFDQRPNRLHRHHSTLYYYEKAQLDDEGNFQCATCKLYHPVSLNLSRNIVIFTSSTLHDVFLNRDVRVPFHMEFESICGGRLTDLYNNWRAAYTGRPVPTDIIIITGLNDVPHWTETQFLNILKAWHYDVLSDNPSSTLRVCRLLRPPRLACFEANGPEPEGYVNRLERLNRYNWEINIFNEGNGHQQVVGFHTEGMRTTRTATGTRPRHHFNAWREVRDGREMCLHLNEKHRVSMFLKLLRYIQCKIININ